MDNGTDTRGKFGDEAGAVVRSGLSSKEEERAQHDGFPCSIAFDSRPVPVRENCPLGSFDQAPYAANSGERMIGSRALDDSAVLPLGRKTATAPRDYP